MKKLFLPVLLMAIITLNVHAQNVGINTTTPQASLDINGDLALRIGVINLPNTTNADVNTTTNRKSVYRITSSAASATSISGLTGGVDGRTITLMNTAALPMSLVSDGVGNASTAANRILTSDGNALSISTNGAVTLLYDGTASRWRVSSFSKPDAAAGANVWATGGNDISNTNTGSVNIGSTGTNNSEISKLFITTNNSNNGYGLTHYNGSIKLSTITGDRIGGTPAQNGAWIGTTTNHPLMLMTSDVEAMKVKANGNVQIGYNASTQYLLKGHDWAMLDVFERPGGTGNTLAVFGKTYGLSIQSYPAAIGFNEYNDPTTPSHTPKIMTTGNAARNTFDADYGRLDWETFSYGNGSDIAAGTPQKIMSLSTAVAGVAGGGSQSASDRLSVFTASVASSSNAPFGFLHKQGAAAVGTRINQYFGSSTYYKVGIGTQTNDDLNFFTNNSSSYAMTIATDGYVGIGGNMGIGGNVGIGTTAPADARLSVSSVASNSYPLKTYASGVGVGIKANTDTGYIGTLGNQNFSIFTNSGSAALTVKTNGDAVAGKGIYSNQMPGFNMVPLGVVNVTGSFAYGVFNTQSVTITNVMGSLANVDINTSPNQLIFDHSGADDIIIMRRRLNTTITQQYSTVFMVGDAGFDNFSNGQAIYAAYANLQQYTSGGSNYYDLFINYGGDNLSSFSTSGTYMIYGIK